MRFNTVSIWKRRKFKLFCISHQKWILFLPFQTSIVFAGSIIAYRKLYYIENCFNKEKQLINLKNYKIFLYNALSKSNLIRLEVVILKKVELNYGIQWNRKGWFIPESIYWTSTCTCKKEFEREFQHLNLFFTFFNEDKIIIYFFSFCIFM